MTKKKIVALFVILFMLSMTLMGCAGSASQQNNEQNNQQSGSTVTNLRFGGSSTSTWIYSFCVAISELVNQELNDIQLNVQATAGSSAHYGMLEKDQIDLGSGSTYIDSLPYNGLAPYTAKNDTFKSALVCSVSFGQVCVPEDSDVQKMADLSGKKIGIGGRGSPTSMMAELVMKELGIEAETVTSTPSEMVEMFKDGKIDAIIYFAGAPNSIFLDISSAVPIRFISFTPEEQAKLAYAFSPTQITSAEYNFVSEPVDTVRDLQTVLVSNKVSDEVVYQITKTVYENWDEIVSVAPAAGKVSYKDAVYLKVPIHPGAIKYFEEKGLTIPDELK